MFSISLYWFHMFSLVMSIFLYGAEHSSHSYLPVLADSPVSSHGISPSSFSFILRMGDIVFTLFMVNNFHLITDNVHIHVAYTQLHSSDLCWNV